VTASAHTQLVNDARLYLEATDGALSATLVLDSAMNYALAHNGVSPLRELILKNDSDQPVRGLNLEVELTAPVAGRIAEALRMTVPELGPYGTESMPGRAVRCTFDAATFAQIDEAVTASVQAEFFDSMRTGASCYGGWALRLTDATRTAEARLAAPCWRGGSAPRSAHMSLPNRGQARGLSCLVIVEALRSAATRPPLLDAVGWPGLLKTSVAARVDGRSDRVDGGSLGPSAPRRGMPSGARAPLNACGCVGHGLKIRSFEPMQVRPSIRGTTSSL
jgi:hypothetical protein